MSNYDFVYGQDEPYACPDCGAEHWGWETGTEQCEVCHAWEQERG